MTRTPRSPIRLCLESLGAQGKEHGRLFRVPGGIQESRAYSRVKHPRRLGYYRPDVPPPEFLQEEDPEKAP
jgi:hypothetical protein